ncbi:sulfatase-like hydrolase/transferase, partial [Spirochaetota bacterium]
MVSKDYEYKDEEGIKTNKMITEKPDIYYIILDGYGRNDILKKYYGYDNTEFIKSLQDKGFYWASKSHCNYSWSFLSICSSLNFKYLNYLTNTIDINTKNRKIPYEMIKNNNVLKFVKKHGYTYIHFNSTWGGTTGNIYADKEIGYREGIFNDEFLRVLSYTTVLRIFDYFVVEKLAEVHLYNFKMLETIPEMKESTFTFAHIMPPHHPFIFDRNGNIKSKRTVKSQFTPGRMAAQWKKKDAYIDQLVFVNKKVSTIINTILEKSDIPPIIIIQSDHGPHVLEAPKNEYDIARTSILNLFYLPGEALWL